MSKPELSIVIINKNDRGVADTLQALTTMSSKRSSEIIVVDNSAHKLDDIAAQFPAVQWINFDGQAHKRIAIPEQRNCGVGAAHADTIVFIDANCVPQAGWIDLLVAPIFDENEEIVAGSTRSRGNHESTIHDQNKQFHVGKKYIRECPTINLAFKKSVYQKLGGFDARFDYGSDVDFSWRANDTGYKVRYVPEAQIAHDWGNASEDLKRSYRYGVARARLYKKHPKRLPELIRNDITAVIYPVYIVGLPLTIWFWPYPLLIVVPLLKNGRQKPLHVVQKHLVYAVGELRELIRF